MPKRALPLLLALCAGCSERDPEILAKVFQKTGEKFEATDAAILWYGIDRTSRQRTGEARVPQGKYKDLAGALGAFRTLRGEMMQVAKIEGSETFQYLEPLTIVGLLFLIVSLISAVLIGRLENHLGVLRRI